MSVVLNEAAIQRLLHNPSGPVGREVVRRAEAVKALAKENVSEHTRSGALYDSIEVDLGSSHEGPTATVGSDLYYAIFLEVGTYPHEIRAGEGGWLVSRPDNPDPLIDRQRWVSHPGNQPYPFLEPALRTVFPL